MDGIKIMENQMKYYRDNKNNIFAYDDTQLSLAGDKIAMTVVEVEAHINPPITLAEANTAKKQELETAFQVASKLPVTVGTKSYNGGVESAQAIRDYVQLVSESGGNVFTIWDSSNVFADYTLAQANAIKFAIASKVFEGELNLRKKKNAVNDATTILAVNAVVF